MSADIYDPSVQDLLLVIVFQLGLCVLFLAELVDATRGFETLVGLVGQPIGFVMATAAFIVVLKRRRIGSP